MNNQKLVLTKQNLKDQEKDLLGKGHLAFIRSSFLGTLIVILSGIILYADKIIVFFNWNFEMPSRYESYDFETFIWSISVTISPILLILAAHLKTYKLAYVIPLFCYTLQLWFIIYDLSIVDKDYLVWYAIASCIFIIMIRSAYLRMEKKSITDAIKKAKKDLLK